MRAVIIKDGVVVNATNTETLAHPDGLTMVYSTTAGIGWTYADGVLAAPVEPPKTPEQIQAEITISIQTLLDDKAKVYRYDSIHTACGWADKFSDALALKTWGAACWQKAKDIELEVLAQERAMPTAAEVMAEMPEFEE